MTFTHSLTAYDTVRFMHDVPWNGGGLRCDLVLESEQGLDHFAVDTVVFCDDGYLFVDCCG